MRNTHAILAKVAGMAAISALPLLSLVAFVPWAIDSGHSTVYIGFVTAISLLAALLGSATILLLNRRTAVLAARKALIILVCAAMGATLTNPPSNAESRESRMRAVSVCAGATAGALAGSCFTLFLLSGLQEDSAMHSTTPQKTFQFSLRAVLIVISLVAVSLGLLRASFLLDSPYGMEREFARVFCGLLGSHILAGTLGGSIGGVVRGRRGVAYGAATAIAIMWLAGFLFLPGVR